MKKDTVYAMIKKVLRFLIRGVIFSLLGSICVALSAQEKTHIRVGIFDYEFFYGETATGALSGYGYAYLNEIQKWIPVKFDYVKGSWQECLQMLERGEIDLLDSAQFTSERMEKFVYSKYSTGISYGKLFTRSNNDALAYNDFAAFNGIRVGLLAGNSRNNGFASFSQKYGFKTDNREYQTTAELKEALDNGEVDAIVTSSLLQEENQKAIARFDPNPFYMLTSKNKPQITALIDEALELVQIENPVFNYELYKKYYGQELDNLILTRYELDYIKKMKPLNVVYDSFWPPFESYNNETKTVSGINAEIFDYIAQKIGLPVSFIDGNTYDMAINLLSEKKTDMLLSYDTNPKKAEELGIVLSDTFLSTPICIVGRDSIIRENSIFALPRIYPLHEEFIKTHFPANEIIFFDDIILCYDAIEQGRADFTMENMYAVTNTLRTGSYPSLIIASITTLADNFSFAFRGDIDPILVGIINKGIKVLSNNDIERLLLEYSTRQVSPSFDQFFIRYRSLFWFAALFVLLIVIFALGAAISMQIKNKKALWNLAYIDQLTGLGNLIKFKEDVKKLLENNAEKNYSLAMLDIEHFNLINEMYGFSAGDHVLKTIASALLEVVDRRGGTAARIGTDNFLVLTEYELGEILDYEAESHAFRKYILDKTGCSLEFSVGRYFIEPKETDVDLIFEKVNYAHNVAKKNRNPDKIVDYEIKMKKQAVIDREMENKMAAALENDEFKVFLQPKFRLSDEKLAGAEALVRWVQEDHTLVSPGQFIPLFERNGFITRLDLYMFDRVCKRLEEWITAGIPPFPVSVNFSRLHLQKSDFVEELTAIANRYAVPKNCLEIELTESAIFGTEDTLKEVLVKLHQAGFTLSMDDFGTGYSSLGLLKNLPVDVIKIDRSFFIDIENSKRAQIVIANVMSMAKELKIITVAEGVEQQEHIDFLRKTGCDVVQGYYYAKPMSAADFTAKLQLGMRTSRQKTVR